MSASGIAVMLGAFDAGSAGQLIATVPEIAWEASLGIYLTVKGFERSSAVLEATPLAGLRIPAVAAS